MSTTHVIDLHAVRAYWKTRGLVPDRYLPYYVRWLQRFLAGPGGDSRLAAGDAQRSFVEQLTRDQVPEWQVRQAARAVELYLKHYLCHREEQRPTCRVGYCRQGRARSWCERHLPDAGKALPAR